MKEIEENDIPENQDKTDINKDFNNEVEDANNNLTKVLNLPNTMHLNSTFFRCYLHNMRNYIHRPDSRTTTNTHVVLQVPLKMLVDKKNYHELGSKAT